ncbi:MAG: carboxylating nicotinate-nucleotide diphosphorylase [Actinomycetota bacterium]
MNDLSPIPAARRAQLSACGLDPDSVERLITVALREDLGDGTDITSAATVDRDHRGRGHFVARQRGTIAGLPIAAAVIEMVCGARRAEVELVIDDGSAVDAGAELAWVDASTRGLLTSERTALNLLCHLSGVATLTARWADALAGTRAQVRDTRKTTPGLRALEKYAVRCGGGVNHRMGLSDAALVKDNHIVAAGSVGNAFRRVRELAGTVSVEIEVDDLDGLVEAIEAGADEVLIDNFTVAEMCAAVALRDDMRGNVALEASGGLTLETASAVAATGVDYIAVGELTHSAPVLDIGLDL